MKILSQIRYVLFSFIVLGCFANFAQNEYGMEIVNHSCLLIGITLLVDAFVYLANRKKQKTGAIIYLFIESFLLAFLFIAYDIKYFHLPYGSVFLVLSGGGITLLYFITAFVLLFREFKNGKRLANHLFFIFINLVCAIAFGFFKLMHWPYAGILLWTSCTMSVIHLAFIIFRIKYYYLGERITSVNRIKKIPGKFRMAYIYFTVVVVYTSLAIMGYVPNFYNLRTPPVVQKFNDANDYRAVVYNKNYQLFLDNRIAAIEKE